MATFGVEMDQMEARRESIPILWLVAANASAIGIFAVDTLSTFEFAVAVLYVVVVLIAGTYLGRSYVLIAALGCSGLTVISLIHMHAPAFPEAAVLRAVVSLAAISITTLLALRDMSANDRLIVSQRKRANLARFFAPQIVDELEEQDTPLSITRHHAASILFADMVGFTAFCERLSPDEVIALLRDLQAILSKSVFSHQGIVDKFLGDGLLAVFGGPLSGPADATNAVRCGIDIVQTIAHWNGRRLLSGDEAVRVAIGIHYGPVVQGDIGDENRLELTVVGDTVNLASRVEAYCRTVGYDLLVTAPVLDALRLEERDGLIETFRDLGEHELPGRIEPVRLYGFKGPVFDDCRSFRVRTDLSRSAQLLVR